MGTERRKHARNPARIDATLVANEGLDRTAVAITDISSDGARVRFHAPETLQDEFYMLLPDHRLQPCRLVWYRDGTMGLSFI